MRKVLELKRAHSMMWRDRSPWYWFWHLLQEVLELGLALLDLHEDDPKHELRQIATICLNWLDWRGDLAPLEEKGGELE